jgi:hypothetical protein
VKRRGRGEKRVESAGDRNNHPDTLLDRMYSCMNMTYVCDVLLCARRCDGLPPHDHSRWL